MTAPLDLAGIRSIYEAAPGSWSMVIDQEGTPRVDLGDGEDIAIYHRSGLDRAIAASIVAAHIDLPALLSIVEDAVQLRRAFYDDNVSAKQYNDASDAFWARIEALVKP